MADIILKLSNEFNLKEFQVSSVVRLVDEGNTIPFIARYRKEMTGGLDDQVLRELHERLLYIRNLENRREEVRRLIQEAGKLTPELLGSIDKAETLQEIEDIYRPYRPKRRTRASIAREKGLQPLAETVLAQKPGIESVESIASAYINKELGVNDSDAALSGAMDIIAEIISDNAGYRKLVRSITLEEGIIVTEAKKEEDSPYRMYYDYREPVASIAPHRVLAIDRGEREGFLQVKVEVPIEKIEARLRELIVLKNENVFTGYVEKAVYDSYERLIMPSIENEVRSGLSETGSEKAVKVFAENLRNLLLQPPIKGKVVLGLDPAYRTGCKIAVVNDTGKVLDTCVIYPTPPQNKIEEAKVKVKSLISKHNVDIISIGNGTASKEAEAFVAAVLKEVDRKTGYFVVSEAGASVYSASKLAALEFPEFDVSLRSAVSIARRLQDPLAELVKIDPKSIGVGQYQHDLNAAKLDNALSGVVEDCVNSVGVDLNTASPSLLSYVSGINSSIAANIVEYRELNGSFKSRKTLFKVKKLGEKSFEQCAGFLRISGGENILDDTSVHPESYEACGKVLSLLGHSMNEVKSRKLGDIKKEAESAGLNELAELAGIGIPTLKDILTELNKPGRDFRDELPKPVMREDIIRIEDLKPGMIMDGTVRNVVDFGAFIDIGVHQDGLVHVSEMSDRFVRNPMGMISVGDIVKVKILDVDPARNRISLSMKGLTGTA